MAGGGGEGGGDDVTGGGSGNDVTGGGGGGGGSSHVTGGGRGKGGAMGESSGFSKVAMIGVAVSVIVVASPDDSGNSVYHCLWMSQEVISVQHYTINRICTCIYIIA